MTLRAEVQITATDRASEVFRRLSDGVDRAQSSFDRISTPLLRFQGLFASLIGGAVVAGLRNLISTIDDLDEAAQGLGTTAVELANLRQAAGEAGVGADTFDAALTRLNVTISNAAAGSKEQAALFKALGVNIRDAGGNVRPTTQVLQDLARRFAQLEDGPAKAALAVDLFGKSGARLLPLLNQGADGLKKFAGLTDDTVQATRALQGEFDRMNAKVDRFKYGLAANAVPAINTFLEALGRIRAEQLALSFVGNSPVGALARTVAGLGLATKDQLDRQQQVREALLLSEGAYSNEGRGARENAQDIRDKAAADAAAEAASRKKTRAVVESSNAYAKEFADVARIRAARQREREEDEQEQQRAIERARQRVDTLTGRSAAAQQAEDLQLLGEALNAGRISIIEYDLAVSEVFGPGSDVERGMQRQADLASQLGLQMASSLGEIITSGGRAGDVWKALGQDITKLITQLLIIKPLARELEQIFRGIDLGGSGSAGGGSSIFGGLLNAIGGLVSSGGRSSFDPTGLGAYAGAGIGAVNITNYIDGAIDRARVASYVETGVKAGLAQSWDNVARGGSGTLN